VQKVTLFQYKYIHILNICTLVCFLNLSRSLVVIHSVENVSTVLWTMHQPVQFAVPLQLRYISLY